MIFDSNLVILGARPDYPGLLRLMRSLAPAVSAVTAIEVLGYHKLSPESKSGFEAFFRSTDVLPISEPVVGRAVALRQARKMTLGDAIVAATALEYDPVLYTHNPKDFHGIAGLTVIDPVASGDSP